MNEADQRARAIAILTKSLKGEFISRFSVGDTFDLCIGDYYLVAQNVVSEDELLLNQWYQAHYHSYPDCVDKENVSKATILAAHLRKTITSIELDDDCKLTLHFENDSQLLLPTDVDIVDWQWALNTTGADPYQECAVGCFWAGEITVDTTDSNDQ